MAGWLDIAWQYLKSFAIAAVVAGAVTAIWFVGARLLLRWDKPLRGNEVAGAIRPWPPLWWLTTIFLGFIAGAGFLAGAATDQLALMVPVSMFLAVLTWCSFLQCLPGVELRWSADGLEGPSSQFWFSRREIRWDAISRTGTTWFSYQFVEDDRGDRVFWSTSYVGSAYVWEALLRRRSDIAIE